MSNFVEIGSSPGEIIGIAGRLRSRGSDLAATIADINEAITSQENEAKTFPPDQFTNGFLKEYHKAVPASDGNTHPANVAVRMGAAYCGEKLIEIGDFVSRAMTNYEAVDQGSADDITRTDV